MAYTQKNNPFKKMDDKTTKKDKWESHYPITPEMEKKWEEEKDKNKLEKLKTIEKLIDFKRKKK
jgi:hypothetical protein